MTTDEGYKENPLMKILICLDLSDSTDKIIEQMNKLTRSFTGKLFLLHVADPEPDFIGYDVGPQSVRDTLSTEYHQEHQALQRIARDLREHHKDTTALLVQGPTVETILKEAHKLEADMIVLGSHGHGAIYDLLVGSVSKGVLHKAPCPIFIVPTHARA